MARAPSFCGVILAAGESSRMGRDKALLPWPPQGPEPRIARTETFLSANIHFLEAHTDMVLVVAGKNAHTLAPLVYATSAFLVVNPTPEHGQFSSVQTGLREVLNRGRDAAVITLVDRPPVRSATLTQLRSAFIDAAAEKKWAVIPQYGEKHGHPVLIGREMMEAFLRAPVTANAREIEHQHLSQIVYVPVDDPHATLNVDTPEDYARLQHT
ncbi:MAG TPA: nucleotidyltransferase family protein [Terriglobales bacterium]|nr:nucleotidyltransferase family protein [Terriglobales bacterium]